MHSSAAEKAAICSNMKMLSGEAVMNLQSLLRVPDNKMRHMPFKNEGCPVIPSLRQIRQVQKTKPAHLHSSKVESCEMSLKRAKDDGFTSVPMTVLST